MWDYLNICGFKYEFGLGISLDTLKNHEIMIMQTHNQTIIKSSKTSAIWFNLSRFQHVRCPNYKLQLRRYIVHSEKLHNQTIRLTKNKKKLIQKEKQY